MDWSSTREGLPCRHQVMARKPDPDVAASGHGLGWGADRTGRPLASLGLHLSSKMVLDAEVPRSSHGTTTHPQV